MNHYVIGMDGGGTKTTAAIMDGKGVLIDTLLGGSINYNGARKEKVDANILSIFRMVKDRGFEPKACKAICIGAAGISNPNVREFLLEITRSAGYTCDLMVVGDEETAFAGALDQSAGIILISGTGSICYGRDKSGTVYRSGGFGHLIDDVGSGYAIGRDILASVVQAFDKRSEPTLFTQLVFEYLKIGSINELIAYVYHPDRSKKDIAALSILIENAYNRGDPKALQIIRKSAEDLIGLVTPVIRQMKGNADLAATGSVLFGNKDIYQEFKNGMKRVHPLVTVIKPRQNAAYGAAMLALKSIQTSL